MYSKYETNDLINKGRIIIYLQETTFKKKLVASNIICLIKSVFNI